MKAKIIPNQLIVEKYFSYDTDYQCRKINYFCKNDSTDETNFSTNDINEYKFDFQIPNFLNDQAKIYFKIRKLNPIIPEWYLNLNKDDFNLFEDDSNDELLFS